MEKSFLDFIKVPDDIGQPTIILQQYESQYSQIVESLKKQN